MSRSPSDQRRLALLGLALLAAGRALAQGEAGTVSELQSLPLLGHRALVPADWQALQPSSRYRLAQMKVPGQAGGAEAELVVFYFGPGQGGSVAANVERWASQFSRPDGQPVMPQVQTLRAGAWPATLVELNGTYARGVGMGPVGAPRPDQTLLAAVVEAPEGHLTFQLHGDRNTVQARRAAFMAMLMQLAPR